MARPEDEMPFQGMIDIHCHVLPGLDDGAGTLEEAVEMARHAAGAGASVVFATPHVSCPSDLDMAGEIPGNVASLQSALDDLGIDLRLVPGAEVFPSDGLLEPLGNGLPITLGRDGRFILLDTPLTVLPIGLENLLFDLQTRGVTPILAHPERSLPIQREPELLERYVQQGALVQVNASCVFGKHGHAAEFAAFEFLRHRWVHFIASDAHSPHHRRSALAEAAEELSMVMGPEVVAELVHDNPRRVLNGESVSTNPAVYKPKRRSNWLSRLVPSRFAGDLCR
jgi:protein-tyrosine phosphatase